MANKHTKETGTEIAELEKARGSTELAEFLSEEDSGTGLQDVGKDEIRIPFLRILDPKSPQCRPAAQGGLPGAKGGSILNTATNEVYDGEKLGIVWIPCRREHNYVEFIPKNPDGSGGGFVGVRVPEDPLILELRAKHGKFGKLPTDNNTELAETYYQFGVAIPVEEINESGTPTKLGTAFRAMIGFSSTQIPKHQQMIGRLLNIEYEVGEGKRIKPALWAHRWHFTTQYETKKSNSTQSWYGWVCRMFQKNPDKSEAKSKMSLLSKRDPLYIMAKDFNAMLESGEAKAYFAEAGKAASEPAGAESDIPM